MSARSEGSGAGEPSPVASGGGVGAGGRAVPVRREMAYAVLLCVVGSGLALWAATRTWAVELTLRPTPLPPVRESVSGAGVLPWLPALALVALAGGGAVLATRGRSRRVLGVLIALLGGAVAAGGGYGLVAAFDGAAVSRQWPALCLVGGVLAVAGGLLTARRGQGWPAMGARYERPGQRVTGPVELSAGGEPAGPVRGTTQAWEALDRGEDPTVR